MIDREQAERMSLHIANWRDKMKREGKRTTEATRQIFEIPPYDWTADPKGYCKNLPEGRLPPDRCSHCGYRFVGSDRFPFCSICTIAMYGDAIIPTEIRDSINSRIRIPEDMTEIQFVIREKKRTADIKYEEDKKKRAQPITNSDFKRAVDLA